MLFEQIAVALEHCQQLRQLCGNHVRVGVGVRLLKFVEQLLARAVGLI